MSEASALTAGHIDAAVAAFDRVLAAKPRRDGEAFTEATKAVCAYRDQLRAHIRQAPDGPGLRQRLKSANLAITLLISGHYPLGETPWGALEGLRGQLEALRPDAPGLNLPKLPDGPWPRLPTPP